MTSLLESSVTRRHLPEKQQQESVSISREGRRDGENEERKIVNLVEMFVKTKLNPGTYFSKEAKKNRTDKLEGRNCP